MATVVIREHNDLKRNRSGDPTGLLTGELVTDEMGAAIKTVTTTPGSSVESAPLTSRTHFVAMEADADVRYVVRPKRHRYDAISATANHSLIPAGSVVIEAVYPGAVLAFLQTSGAGGELTPYQQSYVPVLAL